jgi:hypothetical protein
VSGRRTKQLRKECARRLGRASLKADGHVTYRAVTVLDNRSGRSILRRALAVLKPKPLQIDEFRFFKRRRRTPAEERTARKKFLDARKQEVAA